MPRPKLNITNSMIEHAQKLKANGYNDRDIAFRLGMSIMTFKHHKHKFSKVAGN